MPRLAPLPLLALSALLAAGCQDFPTSGLGYIVVDTAEDLVDASPGDLRCRTAKGNCSLRAAIQESNAMPGANTVQLPAGLYTLQLAGGGGAESGDLEVTDLVQVLGAGAANTVIDGNRAVLNDRIFQLQRGRLNLLDLTLRNGGSDSLEGGAILVERGALLLRRTVLSANTAFVHGGALYNQALAEIEDSTFDGNDVAARGGAISNGPTGNMGIDRSTLSNNRANLGGGIDNEGELTLYNVTVSGNAGSTGPGGIHNLGSVDLNNVTVAFNTNSGPDRAAGVNNEAGSFFTVSNSILAKNTNRSGPHDCSGSLSSRGYNLLQDSRGCTFTGVTTGNQVAISRLEPLASNGGPTRTHALGLLDPAQNAGNPATPGSSLAACRPTDQRGVARPREGRCDIGAFEH